MKHMKETLRIMFSREKLAGEEGFEPSLPDPEPGGKMLEKVQWAVIYANIPLWVAIGFLAFLFQQWQVVKFLVGANILVLLILSVLSWRQQRRSTGRQDKDEQIC